MRWQQLLTPHHHICSDPSYYFFFSLVFAFDTPFECNFFLKRKKKQSPPPLACIFCSVRYGCYIYALIYTCSILSIAFRLQINCHSFFISTGFKVLRNTRSRKQSRYRYLLSLFFFSFFFLNAEESSQQFHTSSCVVASERALKLNRVK